MSSMEYYVQSIFRELSEVFENSMESFFWIIIIIGILQCFMGYKLFRVYLWILGALIGSIIAILVALLLQIESMGVGVVLLLLGLFSGGAIMFKLHQLGVFLLGGALGALMVLLYSGVVQSVDTLAPYIIVGCIIGFIAVAIEKPLIIFSSAITGASMIVYMVLQDQYSHRFALPGTIGDSLLHIFNQNVNNPIKSNNVLLEFALIWLALVVFGIFIQYKTTSNSSSDTKISHTKKDETHLTNNDYRFDATEFNYEKAMHNGYQKGEKVFIEGLVLEAEDDAFFLMPKAFFGKSVVCILSQHQRILKHDIVKIFARYNGTFTYKIIEEETAPSVLVDHLEVVQK